MVAYDDRVLTPRQKEKILEKYDFICAYCYGPAECVDHVIPWIYIHDDSEDNLVASCWLCNLIAGDKLFIDGFSTKRDHILRLRYKWIKKNPIVLWLQSEVDTLGYVLRVKIERTTVVLQTEEQRKEVKRRLLEEGFRVISKQR